MELGIINRKELKLKTMMEDLSRVIIDSYETSRPVRQSLEEKHLGRSGLTEVHEHQQFDV